MWLVSCGSIPRLIISFALNVSFVRKYVVFHCARLWCNLHNNRQIRQNVRPNSCDRQRNLHKNRQNRQIRQYVRPISVDVICIKIVRLTDEISPESPFSPLPAFLDISGSNYTKPSSPWGKSWDQISIPLRRNCQRIKKKKQTNKTKQTPHTKLIRNKIFRTLIRQ